MKDHFIPILQDIACDRVFDLDTLTDSGGTLKLHLSNESGKKFTLSFDDSLAFRKLDEGDALAIVNQAKVTSKLGLSFYRVENSQFLEWFLAQGYGVRASERLLHISVMTSDDIIDVICLNEPKVVA